ncbi:MAG: YihA family ribosome biogenesis GTP-binding protein [Betaproteobacteria bacterium]|nr:YihA family ribosome biogenesis GTP-binding protein [Betaproteobacteria bacterium]
MSPSGSAQFFRAAHGLDDFPPDGDFEVAFAGRSNAGKSSAINALTHRRHLAFASKAPGRTQAINFFNLGRGRFLVDLPGYGYAAVSKQEKRNWGLIVSAYIQSRSALRGLIVVMDARHPFTALDRQMLEWIGPLGKPAHVLLTKADKLNKKEAKTTLAGAEVMARQYRNCSVQLFSSTTGTGVSTARKVIAHWLRQA